MQSDKSGKEYDTSSPFPPTTDQLRFTGKMLGNSIAALFAQQSPSPEISYAAVLAEQLRSYTQPIIDFTVNQFKQECCGRLFGDLNFAKAAANKALNNLEKILLFNNHYQLMWDFSVWDIYNPPSLSELKLLSKRHPYQPISELLREEVYSFKKIIHSHIESIIQYRDMKYEGRENWQNEGSSRRYCYPPSKKYFKLENNKTFNVVGGREYESLSARDFQISTNELIALQINSEAKFKKVFRDGTNICFLMPAQFKDNAMRSFFRGKFEEFINGSNSDHRRNLLNDYSSSAVEKADFADEHIERRKCELEYVRGMGSGFADVEEAEVSKKSSTGNPRNLIDVNLNPIGDKFFTLQQDRGGISCSLFKREVERAQKYFIDNREVCLLDWQVRDDARELLQKLCVSIKEIISGHLVESDSKEAEAQSSRTLHDQANLYFDLIRKTNVE